MAIFGFYDIILVLFDVIGMPFVWLSQLYNAIGLNFLEFLTAIVVISAFYKYILSPFFTGSGSLSQKK